MMNRFVRPGSGVRPYRALVMLIVLLILLTILLPFPGNALSVAGRPAAALTVAQYAMLEVPLPVSPVAKNPYDPAQADVTVSLTSPSGRRITLPAFYMRPYADTCTQSCTTETLVQSGSEGWRFRFTPDEVGEWQYVTQVKDQNATSQMPSVSFTVEPSNRAGFIRVGANKRYFTYTNGQPYFPIGMNLGWSWPGGGGTLAYVRWLQALSQVGANYARLFIDVPWFISLERSAPLGDYGGNQEDAWRLDTILQAAEKYGIALQINLVWSQRLGPISYPPVAAPTAPLRPDTRTDWSANPYNVAKGGVVPNAASFFTSDTAEALIKQRLRYIMARWGYSPAVFAWEVIDQLDRTTANNGAISAWLSLMVDTLRSYNPAGHLITAGVRDPTKASLLNIGNLDFNETRFYQRRPAEPATDQVAGALGSIRTSAATDRPILLTDFSLNPWFEPTADDPKGTHVEQTMWAAALSGAAGSAMSGWWDTYLFPQQIVEQFRSLAAFSKGIPWPTADLRPVEVALQSDDTNLYRPLIINAFGQTFGDKKAPDTVFRVLQDRIEPGIEAASSFLYPVGHSLYQPLKIQLNAPVDTEININTRRMADRAAAQVNILIDGKLVFKLLLNARAEPAMITLPLPAGTHILTLDNDGKDSFQLDSLRVAAYTAVIRAVGLIDTTSGIYLGWFQHRDSTWDATREPAPVSYTIQVPGLPIGVYRVEYWDVENGQIAGEERITVSASPSNTGKAATESKAGQGILEFRSLPITRMFAVRAFRVDG